MRIGFVNHTVEYNNLPVNPSDLAHYFGSRKSHFDSVISHLIRTFPDLKLECPYLDFRTLPQQIQGIDALILAGSAMNLSQIEIPDAKLSAFHYKTELYAERDLLRANDIPVLGICFGHQMLAFAYGNIIRRMKPPRENTENKPQQYHNDRIRIAAPFDLIPSPNPKGYEVNLVHNDEVQIRYNGISVENYDREILRFEKGLPMQIAGGVQVVSLSAQKVPMIIQISRLHQYGIQFHPEYDFRNGIPPDPNNLGRKLFENFVKIVAKLPLE